jgi:rhodanese-related sulfurtransferase
VTESEVREIDVEELEACLDRGAVLVDVRQPDEYEAGHVPTARLVPLDTVPDRLDDFPRDRDVLVICRSGSRSRAACAFLVEEGVAAINVGGGTLAWLASGRDLVAGAQPS